MTDDRQTRAQAQKQTRADRMRKYDPTDLATDRQPEESRVTIEQDHENDILDAERRGAVDVLRSSAAAWADLQVPDGRWSAGEFADWLSIKADLVAEGGDF